MSAENSVGKIGPRTLLWLFLIVEAAARAVKARVATRRHDHDVTAFPGGDVADVRVKRRYPVAAARSHSSYRGLLVTVHADGLSVRCQRSRGFDAWRARSGIRLVNRGSQRITWCIPAECCLQATCCKGHRGPSLHRAHLRECVTHTTVVAHAFPSELAMLPQVVVADANSFARSSHVTIACRTDCRCRALRMRTGAECPRHCTHCSLRDVTRPRSHMCARLEADW